MPVRHDKFALPCLTRAGEGLLLHIVKVDSALAERGPREEELLNRVRPETEQPQVVYSCARSLPRQFLSHYGLSIVLSLNRLILLGGAL